MVIPKFDIGSRVNFLIKKGDDEGFITAYMVRQNGIVYEVMWSNKQYSLHYDFELKLIEK